MIGGSNWHMGETTRKVGDDGGGGESLFLGVFIYVARVELTRGLK